MTTGEKRKMLKKGCLAIPLLIMMIAAYARLLFYYQVDDTALNYISMGGISGKPDYHLYHIKSLYGITVKGLYYITDSINWFGVSLLLVILVSVYTLIFVLKKYINYIIALIIGIAFELVFCCWLTYTNIAYLAIAVAIVKAVDFLIKEDSKRPISKYILNITLILFLAISSYCLRDQAFFSGLITVVPLLFFYIKKINIKLFLIVCCVFIINVVLINLFESYNYNDTLWKDCIVFNEIREKTLDKPIHNYNNHESEYKEIGFSKNDYICLTGWHFQDKKVFSIKNLNTIVSNNKITDTYNFNFFGIIINLIQEKEFIAFLAFTILLLLLSKKKLFFICQGAMTIAMVGVLYFINRPIIRVYVPLYLIGLLSVVYYFIKNNSKINWDNKKRIILGFSILVVLIGFLAPYTYQQINTIKEKRQRHYKDVEELNYIKNHPKDFFVSQDMRILVNADSIIDIKKENPYKNLFFCNMWTIYNDTYYQQAKEYNFKYKDRLLIDLAENKNFYYLCHPKEWYFDVKRIETYIEEHTGKEVKVTVKKKFKRSGDILYEFNYNK